MIIMKFVLTSRATLYLVLMIINQASAIVYTIDDYTFWITVGVIAGLIVLGISKALDWAKDMRLDIEENSKHIEELERKFENMLGSRRQ